MEIIKCKCEKCKNCKNLQELDNFLENLRLKYGQTEYGA